MKTGQPKNVQKSIRISEEVAAYIEKQEGNGFNEKLCNMVLYCMEREAEVKKTVAEAEERLKYVSRQIDEKSVTLSKLCKIDVYLNSCLRVIQ